MKVGAGISLSLFVAGVATGLLQLWLVLWSPELFAKIMITMVALIIVFLVLFYYEREGRQHDNIRRGGEMDD